MIVKSKSGKRKIETTFLGEITAPKLRQFDPCSSPQTSVQISENTFKCSAHNIPSANIVYKARQTKVEEYEVAAATDRPIVEAVLERLKIQASTNGKTQIEPPKVQKVLSVRLRSNDKNINLIQVQNVERKIAEGATVKAMNNDLVAWTNHVFENIILLAANEIYTAIVTSCQSLQVFHTSTGMKLLDWLIDKPVSLVTLNCDFLLLITSDLNVIVINLDIQTIHAKLSFQSLLNNKGVSISAAALTDNGVPLVVLNNGESLYFDLKINVWVQIETASNSLASIDSYLDVIKKSVPYGVISRLFSLSKPYKKFDISYQSAKTIDEENALEVLINALIALDSPEELRLIIIVFVQRLLVNGRHHKLNLVVHRLESTLTARSIDFSPIKEDIQRICKEFSVTLEEIERRSATPLISDDILSDDELL
ncbi:unnamed protein product [Bursaphelenchus xylophilus]|uniref:(pine wood nematode) hypothetical protein n=1 Tax=Bursaphelenchus xylophilus TaxID=6326 RepID=A0A7I8WSK0_BURXY|nr:unnamed protein product [Bursaphelenchus xylophilus]CAG9115297.1 unnamed protein product [Bursaphelenchus xylophilus]